MYLLLFFPTRNMDTIPTRRRGAPAPRSTRPPAAARPPKGRTRTAAGARASIASLVKMTPTKARRIVGHSGEEEISGEINGLTFTGGRPVVGADVLLYESSAPLDLFILVDGRWETCRFLGTHLRGKYRHRKFVARKFETFQYIGMPMAW